MDKRSSLSTPKKAKFYNIDTSSYFGAFIWRLGSACCPCFGRGTEESPWQLIARQFVRKMTTASGPAAEGQQLIKRTKSEEEILKKRPKRKVVDKKIDENVAEKESDVASVTSTVTVETSHVASTTSVDAVDNKPTENVAKSDRKMKPPPLPPRQGVAHSKMAETSSAKTSKKVETVADVAPKKVDKVVDVAPKKVDNHVGSNGTPKGRVRPDPRFVTEDKRSQSMTRLTASSNPNPD